MKHKEWYIKDVQIYKEWHGYEWKVKNCMKFSLKFLGIFDSSV